MKIKIILLAFFVIATISIGLAKENKILRVGDKAPEFLLQNAVGEKVSLQESLKKGLVILTWYRGAWCPYCNLALAELQQHLDDFRQLNAELIAISPQVVDTTFSLKEREALQFTVLSDLDNKVAQKYGITFQLDPEKHKLYEERISLSKYNGNEKGILPIPATYIIDQEGIIRFEYINRDYTKRVDPKELVRFLQKMRDK